MILFLDFDGVMHPVDQRNLFCREDHLARVLSHFQEVEIVITSSWRLTHSLKNMQTFFLTDLQTRIVGITPIIEVNDSINEAKILFLEIQKYLEDTGNQHRHWVALDDDASLFPSGCPELILCDGNKGFGVKQATALLNIATALIPAYATLTKKQVENLLDDASKYLPGGIVLPNLSKYVK